jgi:hypothetical protein
MGELLLLKPHIRGEKENRLGSTCQSKIAKLLGYYMECNTPEKAVINNRHYRF